MSNKFIEIPEDYLPAPEELPGDLALIATQVEEVWPDHGVRVAIVLSQLFPGIHIYIRNVNHLIRQMRDDAIREDRADGMKIKQISIKYKLATRTIEKILAQKPSQKELAAKQYNLFELTP